MTLHLANTYCGVQVEEAAAQSTAEQQAQLRLTASQAAMSAVEQVATQGR